MKKLALVLLLFVSCESAKLRPFVSFTQYDGTTLGINGDQSRFVNSPNGDAWTVGIMFEFPLGPSSPTIVKIAEFPRAPIDVRGQLAPSRAEADHARLIEKQDERARLQELIDALDKSNAKPATKEEQDMTDEALRLKKELESMSTADKIWLIVFGVAALFLGFGFVKLWKLYKNGNGRKANGTS